MTIVGVVSDTHLPRFGRALPRALEAGLRAAGVTRILHCGDFTDPLAAELFEEIAPFDAVAGNNDGSDIVQRFGRKKIVIIEDVRIGLVHGDDGRHAADRNAAAAFAGERVDVVCFGHSHKPLNERRDGVLFLNPGSPTDKRVMPTYSYAILTIDGSTASAGVFTFADRSIA
jgi:hypothetical protein